MQVQLKQSEIVNAIKGYLTSQGINLAGKDVQITFTAGRKESGLTADVDIQELYATPVNTVPAGPIARSLEEPVAQPEQPVVESPVTEAEPLPVEEAPKTPTTSLFNA